MIPSILPKEGIDLSRQAALARTVRIRQDWTGQMLMHRQLRNAVVVQRLLLRPPKKIQQNLYTKLGMVKCTGKHFVACFTWCKVVTLEAQKNGRHAMFGKHQLNRSMQVQASTNPKGQPSAGKKQACLTTHLQPHQSAAGTA